MREEEETKGLLSDVPGMTLAVARACVTGVAYNRPLDSVAFAHRRGVRLNEDAVFDIAALAQREWGLDLPRSVRAGCYLCGRDLPLHLERLCSCFMAGMPGIWIDLSRASIEALYSAGMGDRLAATMECLKCQEPFRYTIETANRVLQANRAYAEFHPHKHCKTCHPSRRPSQPPPPLKGRPRLSLQQLAAQVSGEQPTA